MPWALAKSEWSVELIVVDDAAARQVAMPTETDPISLVADQYRGMLGQRQLRVQEGVLP